MCECYVVLIIPTYKKIVNILRKTGLVVGGEWWKLDVSIIIIIGKFSELYG